eukprot:NODE_2438_length_2213_cov_2.468360.p1 GENE.NODE_2438_length_2213_cov_2.468360~~NODE_2438_length_2213_cov_2.468360.p1  ORF type:complete len:543 (+),score=159.23 NODE_2438_length_2213_cov_2.468360:184-1812(+)
MVYGSKLGVATAENMSLLPGDTAVQMLGRLAPDESAWPDAAQFMSGYMRGEAQNCTIVGVDAGSNPSQWVHDTMNGLTLQALFPGAGSAFLESGGALRDVEIITLDMNFDEDGTPFVGFTCDARLVVPPEVDISIIKDITAAGLTFQMIDEGVVMAVASVSDSTPVSYSDSSVRITSSPEALQVEDEAALQSFITALVVGESKQLDMDGSSSPSASTKLGELKLEGVPFSANTSLRGLNNLRDYTTGNTTLVIDGIDVTGGTSEELALLLNFRLTNPSNLGASMGSVDLELWAIDATYGNHTIGIASIADMTLNGNAEGDAVTIFTNVPGTFVNPADAAGQAAARAVLSNFINGFSSPVEARGASDGSSTSITLLKPALSALTAPATLPGLSSPLFTHAIADIPWNPFDLLEIPIQIQINNTLSTAAVLVSATVDLFGCKEYTDDDSACVEYYTESFGYFSPDAINYELAAHTAVYLPAFTASLETVFSIDVLSMLMHGLGDGGLIKVVGEIDLDINGFLQTVDFDAQDVLICVDYLFHSCT